MFDENRKMKMQTSEPHGKNNLLLLTDHDDVTEAVQMLSAEGYSVTSTDCKNFQTEQLEDPSPAAVL